LPVQGTGVALIHMGRVTLAACVFFLLAHPKYHVTTGFYLVAKSGVEPIVLPGLNSPPLLLFKRSFNL
jgi:hypothetical protein